MALRLNQRAAELCRQMIDDAERLRIAVHQYARRQPGDRLRR